MAKSFQLTRTEPQIIGTLSCLSHEEIIPIYTREVEKFLRNNLSLGEKWQNRTANLLLNPIFTQGADGSLRGSNPYMATFISSVLGLPLIPMQKLRQAYEQNGNATPFTGTYVETGVALISDKNGNYQTNSLLAKKLSEDFKRRDIQIADGRVPDFSHLVLDVNQEQGLVFKLNETANAENIPELKEFKWDYCGKSGLFRACLGRYSGWGAGSGYLEDSDEGGRVVRYDAEGVAPKNFETPEQDLVSKRIADFRKKVC